MGEGGWGTDTNSASRGRRALNSSKTMRPHYQRVIDRKRYDMLFQLLRMLAYLPNAVHWTLPGDSTYLGTGLASRPMVVFFGFVEAFTGWIGRFFLPKWLSAVRGLGKC